MRIFGSCRPPPADCHATSPFDHARDVHQPEPHCVSAQTLHGDVVSCLMKFAWLQSQFAQRMALFPAEPIANRRFESAGHRFFTGILDLGLQANRLALVEHARWLVARKLHLDSLDGVNVANRT